MVLWIKKEIICGYKYKQLDKNVQLGYSIERVKRKESTEVKKERWKKKAQRKGWTSGQVFENAMQ